MPDPKDVVLRYWKLTSEDRFDEAFELIDEDVNWWVLGFGDFESKQRFAEANAWFRSQLVDEHVEFVPGEVIAEGETVAITMTSHAVAKNGKPYDNDYALMFKVRDGRIVWAREYPNTSVVSEVLSDHEAA